MKIAITNAYTWYNKGDAGILLGIINSLKQIYGKNIEINVFSFTPEEDKKRYCDDKTIKNVYSNILNPFPYKHTFIGKNMAILKLFLRMCRLYFMSKFSIKKLLKTETSIKILDDSDLILVCGGGFLGGKKYDSFIHLFQIYINTILKKKVIMMGTSIEPITSGFLKRKTESVIKKVDYIYAREIITYNYLKTFMPENKIELIPDMAFMLEDNYDVNERVQEIRKNSRYVVGLTVRKWNFPNCANPLDKMNNYIQAIARTIDYFYEKYNMKFVFVPQVIVENGNDADTAYKVREKLSNKDAFIIIEDDMKPVEIKNLISNFDLFVGTRMHSNIFATTMCVPTVAIAYEKKTNGIMHTVDLDSYVLEIDNLDADNLIKKVEDCLQNKDIINDKLQKKIPEIRNDIMIKLKKQLVVN